MNANMLKLVAVFFTLAWLIMGVGTLTTLARLPVGAKLERGELQAEPIVITAPAPPPAHAAR